MDYEKKYKEALERARICHKDLMNLDGVVARMAKDFFEEVFPELKESEDEQHCKWILEYLYDGLRKSDEQFKDQFKAAIAWLEKQAEQKPVDKVEPKFRVGDWIIKNDDSSINIDYSCCEITKVENGNYTIESIYGHKVYNTFETFEKDYHLWTIQDAKDGDVLADDCSIFIFRKIGNKTWDDVVDYYVGCDYESKSGIKIPNGVSHYGKINNVYFKPANAEQRGLLFQKMHEAGYEWDAEKKGLKEIEQKPTWSEEDEVGLGDAMWAIEQAMGNLWRTERWLKSVEERMKGE